MQADLLFNITTIILFVGLAGVWAFFQRRAGAFQMGMKAHAQTQSEHEAKPLLIVRPLFGLTWYFAIFAQIFFPQWIAWAAIPLPEWARWAGAGLAVAALALLGWSQHTLGRNFLATLNLLPDHNLITYGPYRWVRHPMYVALLFYQAAIGLLTASWLIGIVGVSMIALVTLVRIPHEEALLAGKFGEGFRAYANRTGRLLPRFS